jgi:hypothetical protein
MLMNFIFNMNEGRERRKALEAETGSERDTKRKARMMMETGMITTEKGGKEISALKKCKSFHFDSRDELNFRKSKPHPIAPHDPEKQ